MRSTFLFGLLMGGLGFAAFAGGCGSTAVTPGSGGTGGASSSHASSAVSTSGSGGMMQTGNHTIDAANDIGVGTPADPVALADAATPDFYKFTGKKGERMIITASAERLVMTSMDFLDSTVTDTVVTLYGTDKMPIAQDDDEWPRNSTDSQLFVELPADGDYYVSVEDCNSYAATHTGVSCADPTLITNLTYQLTVADLIDTYATGTTAMPVAQDGTIAHAAPITYTGLSGVAGQFNDVIIDGNFQKASDKHVFSFTPPANLAIDTTSRPRAEFWVQPVGVTDGDGSTSNIKAWITDSTGTKIISQADQNNYTNGDDPTNGPLHLSFPLDTPLTTTPYYLFVQDTQAASTPATDYYFILHSIGSVLFGQTEKEGPTAKGLNDALAMAETGTVPMGDTGAYFFDGNISTAGATGDVDWYTMTVPDMTKNAEVECEVGRSGSGLRGFTAGLFDATGATAYASLGPEANSPKAELIKGDQMATAVTIPTGVTTALLKVSATSQDPTVTGTYYHCHVFFF